MISESHANNTHINHAIITDKRVNYKLNVLINNFCPYFSLFMYLKIIFKNMLYISV